MALEESSKKKLNMNTIMSIKLTFITLVFSGLLVAVSNPAFATITVLRTDKEIYVIGERIVISGAVDNWAKGKSVLLEIIDANGITVRMENVELTRDSLASASFSLTLPNGMGSAGLYTVKASYFDSRTRFTTFNVEVLTIQLNTDKSSYERSEWVTLTGSVSRIVAGQSAKLELLTSDTLKYSVEVDVDSVTGNFGFSFPTDNPSQFPEEGQYKIKATYFGKTRETEFELWEPVGTEIKSTITVTTNEDRYTMGQGTITFSGKVTGIVPGEKVELKAIPLDTSREASATSGLFLDVDPTTGEYSYSTALISEDPKSIGPWRITVTYNTKQPASAQKDIWLMMPGKPPTLTLPDSPLIVQTSDGQGTSVSYSAKASTANGEAIQPTCSPASGTFLAIDDSPVTVNCTATDTATGQVSDGTFQIILERALSWMWIAVIVAIVAGGAGAAAVIVSVKKRRSPVAKGDKISAGKEPATIGKTVEDSDIPRIIQIDARSFASIQMKCCICNREFSNGQEIVRCPHGPCAAHAHKEELELWLSKNDICPLCRKRIRMYY